jgi:hypothetical protein
MHRPLNALIALALCGAVLTSGCASKAGTGAVVGGAGGALVGGLIGSGSHARAGEGALIGGAVGAIGGALVGHGMDKADEQKRQEAEHRRAREDRDGRSSPSYSPSPNGGGYYSNNAGSTAPAARPASGGVTRNDVMDWTRSGVRDEIIVDRIQRSGSVFYLTAGDEQQLRSASVSPGVIAAMRATAR